MSSSLTLRPFRKNEISVLKSWFPTEEDTLQWAGASLAYPIADKDLKALITRHVGKAPRYEVWAADLADVMVGHLQIWYTMRLRQATLGRIAIAPMRRGSGLSKSLVDLAVSLAFSRPWINRIELRVYDHNAPAIATYRRAGFVLEGTRRQSTPIGTSYWNTHVMSLLREEYEAFDKRTERE